MLIKCQLSHPIKYACWYLHGIWKTYLMVHAWKGRSMQGSCMEGEIHAAPTPWNTQQAEINSSLGMHGRWAAHTLQMYRQLPSSGANSRRAVHSLQMFCWLPSDTSRLLDCRSLHLAEFCTHHSISCRAWRSFFLVQSLWCGRCHWNSKIAWLHSWCTRTYTMHAQ